MGNEMGNNNTTGLIEEENVVADELLEKSSPGLVHEDDRVMGNQPISVGKVGLHEEMRSPGNTDARDKISDEREQPKAPVDIASEGGQIEDGEKVKAIPSEKPRNEGHLLSDHEQVEMDNQLVSIDPTTEDTVEAETFVESASHPKEPPTTPERLDDVPQVLNLVENGNKQETGHTSNMSTDFAPETILEHDKRAEEVGLETDEVLHSEGNQKEEVTGSLTNVELLDGDEGTSTETTLMESDRNGPANQVEEGHSDGRNGLFDKMKETLRSDKPNHQPRHDGVPILDRASSEETEKPGPPMAVVAKGGQVEDDEKLRAIPPNSPGKDGVSLGCNVPAEIDGLAASTDLTTTDSSESEASGDSASVPKETSLTLERLNYVPQVLTFMENGNMQETGYSSSVSADFVPRTILELVGRAEEMELENSDVLQLEGNQMGEGAVADMEFIDGDEGISTQVKVTELDRNVPLSEVEEGDTDGLNGLSDDVKGTLRNNESDHQPRTDEFPVLDHSSKDATVDVRPFQSENINHFNSFEVNESSGASHSVRDDCHQQEEDSSEKNNLIEETEAKEAPYLIGDDIVVQEGAAEQLISSPEGGMFDDEESHTCISTSSTVPNSEATISDFEFEKPGTDLPEIPVTTLTFMVGTKVSDNGREDQFPKSAITGVLNGAQEAETAKERLRSVSNPHSISSSTFPQMQKSPSFNLNIQSDSDHTRLLFQDKAEIIIPPMQEQEKVVTVEMTDSKKSKTPPIRSLEREENEEQEANVVASLKMQEDHRGKEKVAARGKGSRRFMSSLFGNCICCRTVIN